MAQSTSPPYQLKAARVGFIEYPQATGSAAPAVGTVGGLIWDGQLVGLDATGLCQPMSDTNALQLLGMCRNGVGFGYTAGTGGSTDNISGSAGATSVQVEPLEFLQYLVLDCASAVAYGGTATSEIHTATVAGTLSAGTVRLQRSDIPSAVATFAFNANATAIQTAVRGLYGSTSDTSITVAGSVGSFTITYGGTLSGLPQEPLIIDASTTTGATAAGIVRTTAAVAQSWLGRIVYFTDDHTVALTSTYWNVAGKVRRVISATKVLVDVVNRAPNFGGSIGL